MSKVRLTLLFVVLAYVPAIADHTTTVGEIKFDCIVTGSDKDGFTLTVTNPGTEKTCKASCTFVGKDKNDTKQSYTYGDELKVRANASTYMFLGKGGLKGEGKQDGLKIELSSPQVEAKCWTP